MTTMTTRRVMCEARYQCARHTAIDLPGNSLRRGLNAGRPFVRHFRLTFPYRAQLGPAEGLGRLHHLPGGR